MPDVGLQNNNLCSKRCSSNTSGVLGWKKTWAQEVAIIRKTVEISERENKPTGAQKYNCAPKLSHISNLLENFSRQEKTVLAG